MLWSLGPRAGARKQRLFAVACCRRVWHVLERHDSREAVEAAERFAEGAARERELASFHHRADLAVQEYLMPFAEEPAGPRALAALAAANAANRCLAWEYYRGEFPADPAWAAAAALGAEAREVRRRREAGQQAGAWAELHERNRQSAILRDLFGNPFRPVRVEEPWLRWGGGCVPAIAQAIDDTQAFDRLPILADALEDAGCANPDLLAHCRTPGAHVRGCWAVDLLLGKG
jgi:hypothetical protein